MKTAATIFGCILFMWGGVVLAGEPGTPVKADSKGVVLKLLQSVNWEADKQQWERSAGQKTRDILENYLMDENRQEVIRLRALHTLRYFAPKAYIYQFTQTRYSIAMRRMAVRAIAEQWGVDALEELRGLAEDAEPLVRDAIATTLALIASDKAVALLKSMSTTEKHPVVADTIRQALRYQEKRKKAGLSPIP